ncbi:MAG: hypothetical protein ACI9IV_001158 [Paracoccaceae bacterium]|jgi:hypothetical protein
MRRAAPQQGKRVWDLRGLAVSGGMDSGVGIALLEPVPHMDIFLAAFDDISDPRADNARHDLCELPGWQTSVAQKNMFSETS